MNMHYSSGRYDSNIRGGKNLIGHHLYLGDAIFAISPVLLENVPLQLRANMCFQHDGAPPHKARIVQQYLNETYGENWIGINGPIQWTPKSPDLTPLDFFLWGTLKK
ncbi:hypothetical protein NQ317_011054 [Molorchus minor]|uniref:Transposase n=1 Tax=Molorchus minor TaxID=1323400 RepID=A0ABQ9JJS9_9CUCU|nr:hypothetical protein NQ317_011054 [Molorchus minor]